MSELEILKAKITRLEDTEAIKQLKYRYLTACDKKQPQLVRECFVDGEVVLDYGRVGMYENADDMVEIFTNLACHDYIVEVHHAQNPQITILSDTNAEGHWGLYYYLINTRDMKVTQLGAFYEDEYHKTATGWKISASKCIVYSTLLLDANEGMLRMLFGGIQATADVDNPASQAS